MLMNYCTATVAVLFEVELAGFVPFVVGLIAGATVGATAGTTKVPLSVSNLKILSYPVILHSFLTGQPVVLVKKVVRHVPLEFV
jgi:hypothetical protein